MTINTATDPEAWDRALDEALLDTDTFADWLYGHCARQEPVSDDTVQRLVRLLALGRTPEARSFGIPELVFVLMTETPDIAMPARFVLRERYLQAQSERVAAIAWKQQDAEREAGDISNELVLSNDVPVVLP